MQRGSLIVYDNSGKVWVNTCDAEGDILPHTPPDGLPFIETQFGELNGKRLIAVDVTTKTLITEDIVVPLTAEQQQIINLENQLLLAADAAEGGIL
jgi:hypothetical protein